MMIDRSRMVDGHRHSRRSWLAGALSMVMLAGLPLAGGCAQRQQDDDGAAALRDGDSPTGHVATAALDRVWPLPAEMLSGIAADEPTMSDPVEIGAALLAADANSRAAGDGEAVIAVRVRIAPTWHIYPLAGTGEPGMMLPTDIAVDLPAGWSLVGEWWAPPPRSVMGSDSPGYVNDVVFQHRVQRPGTASSAAGEIRCRVQYQACDPVRCMPPMEKVAAIAVAQP